MRPICWSVAISVLLANAVFAGGYQRTKDGRTMVWNNDPAPDDQATWSGARDAESYATGPGTLTWYRAERHIVTGSNLPMERSKMISRYTGEMVHGKLGGMVEALDANGRVYHGRFVNGHKDANWALGRAPSLKESRPNEMISARRAEPAEAPGEGPAESADSAQPKPRAVKSSAAVTAVSPAPKRSPAATKDRSEFDDSLKSLVGPPPALHKDSDTNAAPQTSPPLSQPQTSTNPANGAGPGDSPSPAAAGSPQP